MHQCLKLNVGKGKTKSVRQNLRIFAAEFSANGSRLCFQFIVQSSSFTVQSLMQTFTTQDIANYYDHTEVHYRKFWKMEQSMGLHYGIWDASTKTLADAILNTNRQLANLGKITSSDVVLDAGCGVGGSSIFLAKNYGCHVTGITLSERQVRTATLFSEKNDIGHLANFEQMNYTQTRFPDHRFASLGA